MKVLIVNNMVPFGWGGAEELALHLERNIKLMGHDAEILRIPFVWEPASIIPSQMLLVKKLELWEVDKVIGLKFPAYLINHPNKNLWLLHQFRQVYDMYESNKNVLENDSNFRRLQMAITTADNEEFSKCKNIYTNSAVTRDRLKYFNGFDAEVLLPPLNDPELFTGGINEGYIFAGGRINDMKRQYLLIESMVNAGRNVNLVIAGPPDGPEDEARLRFLVDKHKLHDRVKLDVRFLKREEYAKYMNECSACAYLPIDEDSLGYVTMEAASASKPTITLIDSGGILGLVKDGITGWVCKPETESIADAMTHAIENKKRTVELGHAAKAHWDAMDITWVKTVEKLLL
jgi:glycosyltransferase involved in cell wall biosynthesis